jgi:hypothetical protein
VNGRKRHLIVDVLRLVLEAVVTPADVADRDMSWYLLDEMAGRFSHLVKLWADSSDARRGAGRDCPDHPVSRIRQGVFRHGCGHRSGRWQNGPVISPVAGA